MAKLPTYVSNESVQTSPSGVQASEEAFGGGRANGLGALAQGIDQAGNIIERRKEQTENLWVEGAVSKARAEWITEMDKRQREAGDGASGFTPKLAEDFATFASKSLDNAPTGSAQRLLKGHLDQLGNHLTEQAMHFEAAQRVAQTIRQTNQVIDNDAMVAYRDLNTLFPLMEKNNKLINSLDGRMDPAHREATHVRNQQELISSALRGTGDRNPNEGIALIDSGKLDGKMDATALISLREHLLQKAKTKTDLQTWDAKNSIEGALAQVEDGKGFPLGADGLPTTPAKLAAQLGGTPGQIADRTKELEQKFQFAAVYGVSKNRAMFANPQMAQAIVDHAAPRPNPTEPDYGTRPDGSKKANGFLGPIQRPDGTTMTELSVSTDLKDSSGKVIDFPTIVPTTTPAELEILKNSKPGEPLPKEIIQKAENFAKQRIAAGKSPFASNSEAPANPMTPAYVANEVGDVVPSTLNYKDQQILHAKLQEFVSKTQHAFKEDPGGYVQQSPDVKNSFDAAQLAFQNKDPQAPAMMQEAIQKSLVLQTQMGARPYDLSPLSKTQLAGISADIMKNSDPNALRQTFTNLEATYKGYARDIMDATMHLPKGQAPDFKYIFAAKNANNPTTFNTIVSTIQELKKDPQIYNEAIEKSSTSGMDLKKEFDNGVYFPDAPAAKVANAMALTTDGNEWGSQFKSMVSDVAKHLLVSGDAKTPAEALKYANGMLIDANYADLPSVNGRSFTVPRNNENNRPYSPDEVQRIKANAEVLPKIMGNMLGSHILTTTGTEAGIVNLKDRGIWVTKKDHVELWADYGPLMGRSPVTVKDGRLSNAPDAKPLAFSFEKLSRQVYQEGVKQSSDPTDLPVNINPFSGSAD